MKVLLLRNVRDVGTGGEIVDVSEGYARNFLLARGLARLATEGTREFAERLKKQEEQRHAKEDQALKELAERLSTASCTIARRAAEDGKLFGSVGPSDVAEALAKQGFEIDRKAVQLPEHIKTSGVYSVKVRLGGTHEAVVRVWVVREEGK